VRLQLICHDNKLAPRLRMSGAMCLLPLYAYDVHRDNLPLYCEPHTFISFLRICLQTYSQSVFSTVFTFEFPLSALRIQFSI
jgi:hypothetical protein